MFSDIRTIEDVRYNNYLEQSQLTHLHSSQRARIMIKADYLVSAAKQCRTEETNEGTWREKTENHFLSKFSYAMEWPVENYQILSSESRVINIVKNADCYDGYFSPVWKCKKHNQT